MKKITIAFDVMCYTLCMVLSKQYVAGVIDSDGSISIIKRSKQTTSKGYQYRELVQITWAYEPKAVEVFEQLKSMYGGSVFTTIKKTNDYGEKRPIVKFTAEAKAAERLLKDVKPYLTLKGWQADYVLQMRELKSSGYGAGNPKPENVWAEEDLIYNSMLKLRSRGYA